MLPAAPSPPTDVPDDLSVALRDFAQRLSQMELAACLEECLE
jgi:hypothetical protein